MSARKIYTVNGRTFKLFSQSIKIEGMTRFVFYGRPVDKDDVDQLVKLIDLGKKDKMAEIKFVLNV